MKKLAALFLLLFVLGGCKQTETSYVPRNNYGFLDNQIAYYVPSNLSQIYTVRIVGLYLGKTGQIKVTLIDSADNLYIDFQELFHTEEEAREYLYWRRGFTNQSDKIEAEK